MRMNWDWLKAIIHEQSVDGSYPRRAKARVVVAVTAVLVLAIAVIIKVVIG